MIVLTYPNGVPNQLLQLPSGQGRLDVLCVNVSALIPKPNVDGSVPLTFELLPADHPSGLWLWASYVVKRQSAASGLLLSSLTYTDNNGPAQLVQPNPLSLVGVGHSDLVALPLFSTGVAPLVVSVNFVGVTGSPLLDLYHSVLRFA